MSVAASGNCRAYVFDLGHGSCGSPERKRSFEGAPGETEMALATSEEARRRLEVIVGELRREKFGAKSEKLHPDQYHLPLEDVEIAQGVLDAAQEKAERIIKGRSNSRSVRLSATAGGCRRICRGWNGSSSRRARCAHAAAARWRRSARTSANGLTDSGAIACAGDASPEIRLPPLRERGCAGACTGARGARRTAD